VSRAWAWWLVEEINAGRDNKDRNAWVCGWDEIYHPHLLELHAKSPSSKQYYAVQHSCCHKGRVILKLPKGGDWSFFFARRLPWPQPQNRPPPCPCIWACKFALRLLVSQNQPKIALAPSA